MTRVVPGPVVLEIRGLEKRYRRPAWSLGEKREDVQAVRSLSLDVFARDSFALLGLNGQGKSTMVRTILGLAKADAGEVRLFGQKLTWTERDTALRSKIGYLSENVPFPPYLTVQEVLSFHARLLGIPRSGIRASVGAALGRVGLDVKSQRFRELSKGMIQRAGLAVALLGDPEFLILDEPLSGLDPLGCRTMRNILLELRTEGKTVLFTSHLLSEVEKTATRVGIMHRGRLISTLRVPEDLGGRPLEERFLAAVESESTG